MNCAYCGAELLVDADYCVVCGGRVTGKGTPVIEPLPPDSPKPKERPDAEPPLPPTIDPPPIFEPQPQPAPAIDPDPAPAEYPGIPHDPVPPPILFDGAGIPAGFTYDPETHTHYKSEIVVLKDGSKAERVTYYDTTTFSLTQAEYPVHEGIEGPDYIQGLNQELWMSVDGSAYITTGGIPEAKRRRTSLTVVLTVLAALVLLVGAALLAWLTGWYRNLPAFAPDRLPAPVWQSEPRASASVPSQASKPPSPGTIPDDAPTERYDAPDYTVWPEFGYLSAYYRNAREDEKYIYYRQNGSSLLRIDKQEMAVERLLNTAEFGYRSIDSFALLGDYLYFTVPMGNSRLAYFRLHRGGGQSEFIMTDTGGAMTSSGRSILFWDRWKRELAAYDPAEDIFPVAREEQISFADLPRPEEANVSADDYLYYRITDGEQPGCYRYDLLNGETQSVATGRSGEVFDLAVIGDTAYFLYLEEEYLIGRATVGEDRIETLYFLGDAKNGKPFFAVTDKYLVWQQGQEYYFAPIERPEQKQFMLASAEQPDAVTKDWIIWPGRAYHVSQGKLIDLTRAEASPLFDSASAFGQADLFAGSQEIRNTLLTEPVAKDDEN